LRYHDRLHAERSSIERRCSRGAVSL
jgi:hypothetical protein